MDSQDPRKRFYANLQKRQIPGLNGVRGIAALTVVVAHTLTNKAPSQLAVQMFFLLSGLLITWTMLAERKRTATLSLRNFYIRRFFRLVPALIALLLIHLATWPRWATMPAIVTAFFYVSNYYAALNGSGENLGALGHTWSLAVEEHFYLIWPAVFRWGAGRPRFLRWVLATAGLSATIRLLIGGAYAYHSTETNAFGVLVGCALALWLWQEPALPRFLFWRPLAVLSLAGVVFAYIIPDHIAIAWRAVWTPLLAILLLQSVAYEWPLLENRFMDFLGRISYSVYLWHILAIQPVLGHGLHRWPKAAAFMTAAIAAGAISYYGIERPIQVWGRRFTSRKSQSDEQVCLGAGS